jgi:hypothetical protein
MIPAAILLRKPPSASGSAAIIRQAQELSRFAGDTFVYFTARRNTKTRPGCEETVDDVSSLWKAEEK